MFTSPKIIATKSNEFIKELEEGRGEDNPMTPTYRRVITTFAFGAHGIAYVVGNARGIIKYRILNKE